MKLLRRVFKLFVDKVWLAAATLACIAGCALAFRLGLSSGAGGPALLAGLGLALTISVLTSD